MMAVQANNEPRATRTTERATAAASNPRCPDNHKVKQHQPTSPDRCALMAVCYTVTIVMGTGQHSVTEARARYDVASSVAAAMRGRAMRS